MFLTRWTHITVFIFIGLISLSSSSCHAQAALLMEEPYGFFGTLNPTGHTAIYLQRVCAETPVKLRRCQPGRAGRRHRPLPGNQRLRLGRHPPHSLSLLRRRCLASPRPRRPRNGDAVCASGIAKPTCNTSETTFKRGSFLHGGWTQLVGVAYERRIYAFRFETTPAQDDALIERMNAGPNRSHFNLLFNNCADFARVRSQQLTSPIPSAEASFLTPA